MGCALNPERLQTEPCLKRKATLTVQLPTQALIACGFPTVALERGALSSATALHIRERYAKFLNILGLSLVHHNLRGPRHL